MRREPYREFRHQDAVFDDPWVGGYSATRGAITSGNEEYGIVELLRRNRIRVRTGHSVYQNHRAIYVHKADLKRAKKVLRAGGYGFVAGSLKVRRFEG